MLLEEENEPAKRVQQSRAVNLQGCVPSYGSSVTRPFKPDRPQSLDLRPVAPTRSNTAILPMPDVFHDSTLVCERCLEIGVVAIAFLLLSSYAAGPNNKTHAVPPMIEGQDSLPYPEKDLVVHLAKPWLRFALGLAQIKPCVCVSAILGVVSAIRQFGRSEPSSRVLQSNVPGRR